MYSILKDIQTLNIYNVHDVGKIKPILLWRHVQE